MKVLIFFLISLHALVFAHALVINEIMSNPVGDDSGREWIELYNDGDSSIDLSTVTISIKGGSFIPATIVSGDSVFSKGGYAIVGSTVSGVTRFTSDYPSYVLPLLKSSVSLVNSGLTSVELKAGGITADTISSYTPAKEGHTYARSGDAFILGIPTPGEENKSVPQEEESVTLGGTQKTISKTSSPSSDIVIYLPEEKVVVAGAPTFFSTYSTTHSGKMIDAMRYSWSFGDGGQSTGSSTSYRYLYPGRYVAQVEGTNDLILGTGRMIVQVVTPDIIMSSIGNGKYGLYIDITNPNSHDLDMSYWKLSIDGALYSFPKNTNITSGVTRFPGAAMGFASTTVSSSTLIKLLFPTMEEVVRVYQGVVYASTATSSIQQSIRQSVSSVRQSAPLALRQTNSKSIKVQGKNTDSASLQKATTSYVTVSNKKDKRLADFMKSFFGR